MTAITHGLRLSAAIFLTVLMTAGALGAGTAAAQTSDRRADSSYNHTAAPNGNGRQFVWPVSGWVAANHHYLGGFHHAGSADISAPHHTPIRPARTGTVSATGWSHANGWYLRIDHGGTGDYTYQTRYSHLLASPKVRPGDIASAEAGTLLGYVSRTGNANMSGPHLHFSIVRWEKATGKGTVMAIPDLRIGSWVHSGSFVPGTYSGLVRMVLPPARPFDVRVTQPGGLEMYRTVRRMSAEHVATLAEGTVVTVISTDRGQYRVQHGLRRGWVAHSGTEPVGSAVSGARASTKHPSVIVRRSPGGNIIGRVPGGMRLTAFGTKGSWRQVQWQCTAVANRSSVRADNTRGTGGCPGIAAGAQSFKYGWVGPGAAHGTSYFPSRVRVNGVTVHGDRIVDGRSVPDTRTRLGTVGARELVTVTLTRNGWYRISYQGKRGWIRGWLTAGRQ